PTARRRLRGDVGVVRRDRRSELDQLGGLDGLWFVARQRSAARNQCSSQREWHEDGIATWRRTRRCRRERPGDLPRRIEHVVGRPVREEWDTVRRRLSRREPGAIRDAHEIRYADQDNA